MTRQKFAESVGVTVDTVEGWVRRGYVKCVKVGRRSLVDIATVGAAAHSGVAARTAAPTGARRLK